MKCKDCEFYQKTEDIKCDDKEKSKGFCNLNFEFDHDTESEKECSDWCEYIKETLHKKVK